MKTTLAYGKNFHFYHEGSSNNYVYLELEDAPYDAGYRRIMVAIPIDVWEVIRTQGGAQLELVNLQDEELLDLVKKKVSERVAEYKRVRAADPEKADLLRFDNAVIFGPADDAPDRQIGRGIEYYRTERDRQREITSRIAQHKVIDIDNDLNENQTSDD